MYRVREFRRVMDRATLLHRAADVWARTGSENAGAGIKVGIIDSGIEISHPAFQDPAMRAPEGYPRYGSEIDAELADAGDEADHGAVAPVDG